MIEQISGITEEDWNADELPLKRVLDGSDVLRIRFMWIRAK
jgi:hypothetical protein